VTIFPSCNFREKFLNKARPQASMVYLIGRHYVFNQETLDELKAIVKSTSAAFDLIHAHNYPLELGLKVTVNEEQVGPAMSKEAQEALKSLPPKTWLLYDPVNRGAGTSYQQILFNPTFSGQEESIVVSADFDQFIINRKEGLESILNLVEDVKNKDALYGVGSRDVPVVLAKHARNSSLRIIHELFHSLAAGTEKLVVNPRAEGSSPAYAVLGESTSGLYVMDHNHYAYPKLVQSMSTAVQHANMQGFATDYYVAIKASSLAPVGIGYVKARENKFYHQKSEEEEYQGIIRLISSQAAELKKTNARSIMQKVVADNKNVDKIAHFYEKKDVLEVQQLMLKALCSH